MGNVLCIHQGRFKTLKKRIEQAIRKQATGGLIPMPVALHSLSTLAFYKI